MKKLALSIICIGLVAIALRAVDTATCNGPTCTRSLGLHKSTPATYISGTGTAGTDNTAMTVKTITLPANSLTQVWDRIRIRTYFQATTGSAVTGSTKLGPAASEVLIADTAISATSLAITEAWLHYIDNTHANILEQEGGGIGSTSAINVAGFDWDSAQDIIFTQTQVVNQHLVVFCVIIDVLPKGV
jgi:hypothetical protein